MKRDTNLSVKEDIEAVRESMEKLRPGIEIMRQRTFLIRGVALGLFYGVIGNILVSHYFEVFKGIVMWQFDKLFWTNLIIFAIILVVILVVSWRWLLSLGKLEGTIKGSETAIEDIEKILRKLT